MPIPCFHCAWPEIERAIDTAVTILIKYTITPSSFDRNHAKPLITYYYYISFSFLFLFFFSLGIILHISLAIRVRPAELCTTVSARTNMVLLVYKVKKKTIAEH